FDAPGDDVRAGVGGRTAAAAGTREPEVADQVYVADDKGDDSPARGGRDQPSPQDAGPAGPTGPAAPEDAGRAAPEDAGPASSATPEHAGPATPTGRAEHAGNRGSAAHHDPAEKAGSGLADERHNAPS